MLPHPLHPAVVHFPIALVVALPVVAIAGFVAIRRGAEPVRAWGTVVGFGLLLFAASWLAVYTGGQQEDAVERVVPENALHRHEEAGERLRLLAGLGAVILGLGLLPGRVGGAGRVAGILASGSLVLAGWQVGGSGGDLVYRYGAAAAYRSGAPAAAPDREAALADSAMLARFAPLPDYMAPDGERPDPALIDLGRRLYYESRLSATGTVSCYTCHPLGDYGTSHRARGTGILGREGPRNDPTTYNAAGQLAQFWDGRAESVEEQAGGPVLAPGEMGLDSPEHLVGILRSIPGYAEAFRAAFPGRSDPITFENFKTAVGAFERGLVTPSPWDRFLEGDRGALTAAQLAGFRTFTEVGCVRCHTGTYVGGTMFQKIGLARPWPDTTDPGRYRVTRLEGDRLVFKVPSLRNVTRTWPYFNDGSIATLPEAVRLMGRYQLDAELTDAQVASIVEYLGALEGEIPRDYIALPALPPGPDAGPAPVAASAVSPTAAAGGGR